MLHGVVWPVLYYSALLFFFAYALLAESHACQDFLALSLAISGATSRAIWRPLSYGGEEGTGHF